MASIRVLKSGKYNTQIRIVGHKPISITCATREEVEREVSRVMAQLTRTVENVRHTLATIRNDYFDAVQMQKSSKDRFMVIFDNLSQSLSMPLEMMTKADVIQYRNTRCESVSGGTVRLELQLLGRVLRWCINEKEMDIADVTIGVKLPEAGKARDKIITEAQYRHLLNCISKEAYNPLIISWETAMRRTEVLKITPSMIDARRRVINLPASICKNGEARAVPLSSIAFDLLVSLCEGKQPYQPLFNLLPHSYTRAFKRAAGIVGLDESICLHSVRHTCITRYAERGLSTVQLMAISGHKSIDMLARYSHVTADSIVQLMD